MHRVGRTGRMGREGVAYTFVTPEEGNELTRIEMRINRLLVRDEMPGMAAVGEAGGRPGGVDRGAAARRRGEGGAEAGFWPSHAAAPPGAVAGALKSLDQAASIEVRASS